MTQGVLYRSAVVFVFLTFAAVKLSAADPPFRANATSIALRDALFEELAEDADRFQRQFGIVKRVVKLVTPTIVHIDARRTQSRGAGYVRQQTVAEAGSGIVIRLDDSLYVLTNRHVVDHVPLENVQMRMADGYILEGTTMWSNPSTDVAVIHIAEKDLVPARLGDSDGVEIGDFVLAVGSPFGLSHSVSYGIVSAKGRWDLALGGGDVGLQDFMQTDAAINPGNSGGPLLNLRGEVIGINTAIASNSGGNEGIGFSIPINLALNVAEQLVSRGSVSTAYLGVVLDNKFSQQISRDQSAARQLGLSRPGGALVKDITPGSPAADAGIERGDIIVEFNGIRVEDDGHLVNLVSLTPLNEVVSVNVVREQQLHAIHVRVGRRGDYEEMMPRRQVGSRN